MVETFGHSTFQTRVQFLQIQFIFQFDAGNENNFLLFYISLRAKIEKEKTRKIKI